MTAVAAPSTTRYRSRAAWLALGVLLTAGQARAETLLLSIRSVGVPPPALQKEVADLAVATIGHAKFGETSGELIRRKCGYDSTELANRLVALNPDKFADGRVRDTVEASGGPDVLIPACVLAIVERQYVSKEGDSPYTISRDLMGFEKDGLTLRKTANRRAPSAPEARQADDFCRLNADVQNLRGACASQRAIYNKLPPATKFVLPVVATSTDLKLDPPGNVSLAEARARITAAAATADPAAFRFLAITDVPMAVNEPTPVAAPLEECTAAGTPFDVQRVFELWSHYRQPGRKVVVSIVDSGLAGNSPLKPFLFKPAAAGVDLPPDSGNSEDSALGQTSGDYEAFANCDDANGANPACTLAPGLFGDHGTHVAGLAFGGAPFVDLLEHRVTPSEPTLFAESLSLRVFRALAKQPGPERIYGHTPAALTEAFNWAQRLSQEPSSVVNFSVGINAELTGYTESVFAQKNIVFVAAAGNDGRKLSGIDTNSFKVFPAFWGGRQAKFFITVGNAHPDGVPHISSNHSKEYVDLFAPGVCLESFSYNGVIRRKTGTSQAAPVVTFAAALLRTIEATFVDANKVKARIVDTADYYPKLAEGSWSGGMLNVERVIDVRADYVTFGKPGEPPQTVRGILDAEGPEICDGMRAIDFSKFQRVEPDRAKYRSRNMAERGTYALEECTVGTAGAIGIRTFDRNQATQITIPVAELQSIASRQGKERATDDFMKKTSRR